jgi:hypothetical protein
MCARVGSVNNKSWALNLGSPGQKILLLKNNYIKKILQYIKKILHQNDQILRLGSLGQKILYYI